MELLGIVLLAQYLFSGIAGATKQEPLGQVYIVPQDPIDGPVTAVYTSAENLAFDGPKLSSVNSTVFDWWYFDAVSEDGQDQVSVIFFHTDGTAQGFAQGFGTVNYILFTARFSNGTIYEQLLPGTTSTVTTSGDGASGVWSGTGAEFHGTPDLSRYTVILEDLGLDISGSMSLKSIAPAHFPAALNKPRQDQRLSSLVGWANAIPDSEALVNFSIKGTKFHFRGYGYHDKNWSLDTLPNSVGSWYWGHAHIGEYSLVYFDTLLKGGTETVNGFLVKDGKVVALSSSGLEVRPRGENSTFPPPTGAGDPSSFSLRYETSHGVFLAELKGEPIWKPFFAKPGWGYTRWAGIVTGGWEGETQARGAGVWEWIRYLS